MQEYPQKEYFIEEYINKGKTREQLAEENNVSVATIKTHLYEKRIIKPPRISKEVLIKLYVEEKKTMKEISKLIGCDRNSVSRAIKLYNLCKENHYDQYDDSLDNEWISLYLDDCMSTFEIAKQYNVSHGTVKRHLIHCNIDIRNRSDAQRVSKNLETLSLDLFDYNTLYELYVVKRIPLNKIGKMYRCAPSVVKRCLNALNIPTRNSSEAKIGLLTGPNHPNWKGGVATLSQRLREFFMTNISPVCRKRDGYQCTICGRKSDLHVHHIISFSQIVNKIVLQHPELDPINDINVLYDIIVNNEEFLDINNLQTVCKDCHLYKIHGYKKTTSSQDSEKE